MANIEFAESRLKKLGLLNFFPYVYLILPPPFSVAHHTCHLTCTRNGLSLRGKEEERGFSIYTFSEKPFFFSFSRVLYIPVVNDASGLS